MCKKKCVHWTQSGQSLAQKFCYANYLPREACWKRKWFKIQHAGAWIISRCFTMKGDTMQLGLFQILILSLVMTRISAEVEHQRDGKGIRMSHWRRRATEGVEFWRCRQLKLLKKASRLQLVQNSALSVARWRQCDIRIYQNYFFILFLNKKFSQKIKEISYQ